jgi:hypothetical protein
MKFFMYSFVLGLLSGVVAAEPPMEGMFSRSAIPIWDRIFDKTLLPQPVRVPSPNRAQTLVAKYFETKSHSGVELVLLRRKQAVWRCRFEPAVGIEVRWAPDSQAFFVTTSNAGRNGWYGTSVFFVTGETVSSLDVSPTILNAFGHPVLCGWAEDPNVVGIRWSGDSKRLVVAAEIVHHSVCDSFGTFHAYEISLPDGRILKSWNQIAAKRLFRKDLGWELRDAPDSCIKNPRSCWVVDNHR